MKMTKCRVCSHDIAWDANPCPKCGAKKPNKTRNERDGLWKLAFIIVIGFGAYKFFSEIDVSEVLTEVDAVSLPESPIYGVKRKAWTANSFVAILTNTSDEHVHAIKLTLHDREGKTVNSGGIPQLAPNEEIEIGPLEGWHMYNGYSMLIEIDGYKKQIWEFASTKE